MNRIAPLLSLAVVVLDFLQAMSRHGLVQSKLGEMPVLVATADDPRAALAYVRRAGEQTLEFRWAESGEQLIDLQTGSRWDWRTGEALAGPLKDHRLRPIAASPIYWTTWVSFYPETETW